MIRKLLKIFLWFIGIVVLMALLLVGYILYRIDQTEEAAGAISIQTSHNKNRFQRTRVYPLECTICRLMWYIQPFRW